MKHIFIITIALLIIIGHSMAAETLNPPESNTQQQEPVALSDEKLKYEIEYLKSQIKKSNEGLFYSDAFQSALIAGFFVVLSVVITGFVTYLFNIKFTTREKEKVFNRQRKAVHLSVQELHEIVQYIVDNWNKSGKRPQFLDGNLITNQPYTQTSNDPSDFYFQKYYLVDTAYLLCSVLGWLELYRQDVTFLRHDEDFDGKMHIGIQRLKESLFPGFEKIEKDKHLHPILLPEEQRAIGEKMLIPMNNQMWIRGYGSFSEHLFRLPEKKGMIIKMEEDISRSQNFWIHIVTRFLTYGNYSDEFLKDRFSKLSTALVSLNSVLGSMDSATAND